MAFDLYGLTDFVNENSGILIKKSVIGADLFNYIDIKTGYASGIVSINVQNITPSFSDAHCGWSPAGTVGYSQINVTVHDKQQDMALCPKELRATWMSMNMRPSAFNEEIPTAQFIAEEQVERTKKYVESLLSTDIIAQTTSAAGSSLQTSPAPAAWTSSNAYAQALGLINALPTDVLNREDLIMFMSYASFNALTQNLISLNNYMWGTGNNVAGSGIGQSVIIPGTSVRAVPVGGWGSSNRVICGPAKQIIAVVGLENDQDRFEIWYERGFNEVRTLTAFRAGVGVLSSEFSTNDLA